MERVHGLILRGQRLPPGLELAPARMRALAEAAVDGLAAWGAKTADARQYSAALPLVPHSVDYVDADGTLVKP